MIYLVSSGRSGSTFLHRLLAAHRRTAWLSGLADRFPLAPRLNRGLMYCVNIPLLGLTLRRRLGPGECYRFWERLHPGFRRPRRDLDARDATDEAIERVRAGLGAALPKRRTALLKLTGWPRIRFLNAVFPNSRFIHLVRDGRAVAASLLQVDFWRGWRGPSEWRFGPLSDADQAVWDAAGRSPAVLAGLQWKILTEAVEASRACLTPERFLMVRYEDLCRKPEPTLERVLAFCKLGWSREIEHQLGTNPPRSANEKWKTSLDSAQQRLLEQAIESQLESYGFQ